MSKSLIVAASTGITGLADNATYYMSPVRLLETTTADDRTRLPLRLAGTLSNLYVYVSSNTVTVDSTVVTVQLNGTPTSITVSYGSDQTGIKEDTTNTAAVAATDLLDYKIVVPSEAGTNNIIFRIMHLQFAPTDSSKSLQLLGAVQTANFSTASTTWFFVPMGNTNTSLVSETTGAKYRVRQTMTASNLYAYVGANARTTDTTIRTRVNGANGAQSLTYSAGQTGVKEDTSNTDSLAAGNDYDYSMTTSTGTETLTISHISTQVISTDKKFPLLAGANGGQSINFNSTQYGAVSTGAAGTISTQIQTQSLPRFNFTASELGAYVSANTIATDPTVVALEINGTASALTFSYNAAQTGLKNDSVHTATVTGGTDEINYIVTTPNTSGSLTFRWWSFVAEDTSPTGTNISINIGDSWKTVAGMQINIGDSWKTVVAVKQNIGDVWKDVF